MSDILFEILKLVIMAASLITARYLIPWLKNTVDADKVSAFAGWAMEAVLYAQQTMQASTGAEKKAVVTEFLKQILTAKNIALSDEQLDVLIESAVKQMKMEENSGITIEAVGTEEE